MQGGCELDFAARSLPLVNHTFRQGAGIFAPPHYCH
jgi:hypothetical protein